VLTACRKLNIALDNAPMFALLTESEEGPCWVCYCSNSCDTNAVLSPFVVGHISTNATDVYVPSNW
jgi:hypothetical protein